VICHQVARHISYNIGAGSQAFFGTCQHAPHLGARSRQRSAIGWFVGNGEKTRCFSAVRSDANGTSRHFAAPQQVSRFRGEADVHGPLQIRF
jgi:hypothetical protein